MSCQVRNFKTLVFDVVKKDVCNALLNLIDKERDGAVVDRSVGECVDVCGGMKDIGCISSQILSSPSILFGDIAWLDNILYFILLYYIMLYSLQRVDQIVCGAIWEHGYGVSVRVHPWFRSELPLIHQVMWYTVLSCDVGSACLYVMFLILPSLLSSLSFLIPPIYYPLSLSSSLW